MDERVIDVEKLRNRIAELQTYKLFDAPDAEKLIALNDVLDLLDTVSAKATPVTRCKGCVHFKPLKAVTGDDGETHQIGSCGLWDSVKGRYYPAENNLCSEACCYER